MRSAKKFGLVPTDLAYVLCHNSYAFKLEASGIKQTELSELIKQTVVWKCLADTESSPFIRTCKKN